MGTDSAAGVASVAPPIDWSPTAARDRLSSTLFLAALFHGVIILGVTFGAGQYDGAEATSVEVVLVTSTSDQSAAPDEATALADRDLMGSGNTQLPDEMRTAMQRSGDAPAIGPLQAGTAAQANAGAEQQRQAEVVASITAERPALRAVTEGERVAQTLATALPGAAREVDIVNEPDDETLISSNRPRELVVSANTRESRIAAYLGQWKRKVEQVGTLNFPRQARTRGLSGNPTLEVVVSASGDLEDVMIRSSSGEPILDDAAIEILRIAAPFDPFPDFLRGDYDVLRFAYEWRFSDGPQSGRIAAVNGS